MSFILYSATGAAAVIGDGIGVPINNTSGMSTNCRALYLTVGSNLYVLNTITGKATNVGDTGLGGAAMVCEGGKLYAGANQPFQIDTLNTSTGAGTFVSNPSGNPAPGNFWGLAPSILLDIVPAKLTFAGQTVGTTSAPQVVKLRNNGFVPMKVTSIEASGDFAQTNTCGARLPARESCTISVTFTPTQTGSLTGSVDISDTAGGSPQHISLSGTGTSQ